MDLEYAGMVIGYSLTVGCVAVMGFSVYAYSSAVLLKADIKKIESPHLKAMVYTGAVITGVLYYCAIVCSVIGAIKIIRSLF